MPRTNAARKRLQMNLLLLAGTLLFCFLVLEISARLVIPYGSDRENIYQTIYRYDERYGWIAKESITANFSIPAGVTKITTNSRGFRTDEFRHGNNIVVLGDSQTWGYGVERNETYSEQLQQRLGEGYAVYNLGMTGYGTVQSYLVLNDTIDELDPQIVIVGLFINDFGENVYTGNEDQFKYARPVAILENGSIRIGNIPVPRREDLAEHEEYSLPVRIAFESRFIYFTTQVLYRGIDNFLFNIGVRTTQITDDFNTTMETTRIVLIEMDRLVREHNATLLVVTIPVKGQRTNPTVDVYYETLCAQLTQANIACRDLSSFKQRDAFDAYYLALDSHMNAQGHGAIADILAQEIGKIYKRPEALQRDGEE